MTNQWLRNISKTKHWPRYADGRWRLFHRVNPFADDEEQRAIEDAQWRQKQWATMMRVARRSHGQ